MALGSQMDDTIDLLVLHQLVESIEVANIHLHELVVGLVLHIFKVSQVASVCQLVKVDDVIFRILVYEKAHHMATNKACTASNYDCTFHTPIYIFIYNLLML